MRKAYCRAIGQIPYGARVMVRSGRAEVAGPELANGTVSSLPWWTGSDRYEDGQCVTVLMDEGIGDRDLHAIANGPIMDPSLIYLPAGKISMEQYRERQRQILNPDESPTPTEAR